MTPTRIHTTDIEKKKADGYLLLLELLLHLLTLFFQETIFLLESFNLKEKKKQNYNLKALSFSPGGNICIFSAATCPVPGWL